MKRPSLRFQFKLSTPYRTGKSSGRKPLAIATGLAALAAAVLYTFHLHGLIGPGNGELQTIQTLSNFRSVVDNPLGLPYKLVASLYLHVPGDSLVQARLAAVTVGMVNGGLFFILAKRWYGTVSGVTATVLFVTSGWLLQTSRYAAGYAGLVLLVLALCNTLVWINNSDNSSQALLLFVVVAGLAIYTPGGIWFLAATVLLGRQPLAKHLKLAKRQYRTVSVAVGLLLVTGLVTTLVRDTSLVRQWAGLPSDMPTLGSLATQAALSVSGFTLRGPADPEVWLAHTPILDVASSVLLVFGLLFYGRHLGNARTRLLASFGAVGIVLTALNGAVALNYLVPLVYLILAGGLAYFLHQWKRVFPRNPIASATALVTLGLLVVCIVSYHGQRYFVAWRYSPQTVQAYGHVNQTARTSSKSDLPYLIQ